MFAKSWQHFDLAIVIRVSRGNRGLLNIRPWCHLLIPSFKNKGIIRSVSAGVKCYFSSQVFWCPSYRLIQYRVSQNEYRPYFERFTCENEKVLFSCKHQSTSCKINDNDLKVSRGRWLWSWCESAYLVFANILWFFYYCLAQWMWMLILDMRNSFSPPTQFVLRVETRVG